MQGLCRPTHYTGQSAQAWETGLLFQPAPTPSGPEESRGNLSYSSFLTLSLPPRRLTVCLAGTFHVPFEGNSVSSHIPSIVRCDQAGVVLLALAVRHLRPGRLNHLHYLSGALQEQNG